MTTLFGTTIFLGAFLLFLVQPMVGRMALPKLGGSPSVWNTCIMFFQSVLLAGYLYAHALSSLRSARAQAALHSLAAALPLLLLPVALPSSWAPSPAGLPALQLLAVLGAATGLPFFLLSSTGPLLQRWFSLTGASRAPDPYFLYATGSAGSLLGLLGYLVAIEPWLTLRAQSWAWSVGYVAYAGLVVACAVMTARRAVAPAPDVPEPTPGGGLAPPAAPRPKLTTQFRWAILAFVPSSLMLGTTQFISTDVAAVPLLWVAPLSLYLLTFIFAYARRNPLPPGPASLLTAVGAVALVLSRMLLSDRHLGAVIALHLGFLFVAAMMCHGMLARERPHVEQLTRYYLLISLGGVAGGVFNSLVAPVVFHSIVEYPLMVVAACLVREIWPRREGGSASARGRRILGLVIDGAAPLLLFTYMFELFVRLYNLEQAGSLPPPAVTRFLEIGVPLGALALVHRRVMRFALCLGAALLAISAIEDATRTAIHQERTFFGVHRVERERGGAIHWLLHGPTRHGLQDGSETRRRDPLGYYHRRSPVGVLLEALGRDDRIRNVAVVGLGAGTLAAYNAAGRRFTFYEIDPAVVRIARDPALFTYLKDAKGSLSIVVGDGRLALAAAPDGGYGVIVLDVFTSDAIPIHLLTQQAVEMYFRKLMPGGLLVLHITSRHIDLEPVVAAIATRLGLSGVVWHDAAPPSGGADAGRLASSWAVLGRQPADLAPLQGNGGWRPLRGRPGIRAWTDDYSNLLSVIHW